VRGDEKVTDLRKCAWFCQKQAAVKRKYSHGIGGNSPRRNR